jgi:hypothetical protein
VDLISTGDYPVRSAILRIGLDTVEVGDRTWFNGSDDFTWTFDASGGTNYDPKMQFLNGEILLSGKLEAQPYLDGATTFPSCFLASTPNITGTVANAYGLYVSSMKDSGATHGWGIYQEGIDDKNQLFGHTAIGDYDPVSNANLYVHQTKGTDAGYYCGNFELKQTVASSSSTSYPTTIASILNYHPTTIETGASIGTVTFTDGDDEIVGSGTTFTSDLQQFNYVQIPTVTGWYEVINIIDNTHATLATNFDDPSHQNQTGTTYKDKEANRLEGISGKGLIKGIGNVEGLRGIVGTAGTYYDSDLSKTGSVTGAAVGSRGAIEMSYDPANHPNNHTGDIHLASCLATYTSIMDGKCEQWTGLGIEAPAVLHGTIDNNEYFGEITSRLTGIGIQPLLSFVYPGGLADGCEVYGILQQGNECNLFNGNLEVNTQSNQLNNQANLASVKVTSSLTDDTDITSYCGFRYETPSADGIPTVTNMYGIFLQATCPTFDGSDDVEKWGIYQVGNDLNELHGNLKVDTHIIEGSAIANYDAHSTISWSSNSITIPSLYGYRFLTPTFIQSYPPTGTCSILNAYGVYIEQVYNPAYMQQGQV